MIAFMAVARMLDAVRYPKLRTTFVLMHVPALAVLALYPLAPPHWVASMPFADGPPVHPSALRNETAAAVSLHFGGPVLIAAGALWLRPRAPLAWLTLLYPPLVFVVILGTGNHYVLDTLVGTACVAAGFVAAQHDPRAASALPEHGWMGAHRAGGNRLRAPRVRHQWRLYRGACMSVLSHVRQHDPEARERTSGEPTRHEWIREIALVLAGLLVYFGVRAATTDEAGPATAHARSLVHLEQTLGIAREGDLQRLIIDHHALVTLANWVYIWGHWPLIAVSAAWLFRHRPEGYRLMRTAIFASGAIGMIIFLAYPVAPPRLTGLGLTDTVTSYSHAYRALQPPSLMDRYAALPSLHFGWDLLVGLTLARFHPRTAVRVLGALMPVAMGLAVIMTANHYVLDVVVGGIVAMAGLAIATILIRARERRAQSPQGTFGGGATWSTHHC